MKKKICIILLITISFLTLITSTSNAFSITELDGNITVDQYGNVVDPININNIGNQALTIISTIGSIVSVIMLIVLGIKYMTGSLEEKATYKRSLLPYFVGAILVFGASIIYTILYNLEIF